MKDFKPMLISCLKGYNAKQLTSDVVSGIIVAVIALPLSIALALASGVGPEEGLYTAIIAGFLIAFLGGSRVQIAGPTAAFATTVAGIVAIRGMDGLIIATLMAGIILIIMGICRLGALIKFIPYTITTGFTAGIAVTIIVGQLKDFFGISYSNGASPIEALEKLEAFFQNISSVNVWAVFVGVLSLAILIIWPKIKYLSRIPASLIAVLVGIAVVNIFSLEVNTIGDLYSVSSKLPSLRVPKITPSLILELLPDAFTIAVLAAIESLLSCVVADGMMNTKHNSNTELIAQGIGNMGSVLFGGIPASGAIARTAANINNGGKTPVAGMVHSVVLLLVLVLLMPYAALIPMPVIAAVLFVVAYNMSQWRPIARIIKTASKSDILVLVLTFFLTIIFDILVAIIAGLVLACLLFMKKMSDETNVLAWKYKDTDSDAEKLMKLPEGVSVYEVSGPLFFGAAERIASVVVSKGTKCVILRMRSVSTIDITAMNSLVALYERCADNGVKIIFSHVNEHPMQTMRHAGLVEKVGEEYFCDHISTAMELAESIVKEDK